ncbi:hypothetical protein FAEPRAM212_02429 [Faecalibacterium prausnitzii M21/2]|uniref:Uncharacterized protein n=1 Tax=Faecalibacterium prausnitzii M21/2 TaxID=411485 RepID=A8SE45_9FIRM|nr:hypothetical protein FAEPRAM212_02429 [Faecalibacterium prausnitzii M21/2]
MHSIQRRWAVVKGRIKFFAALFRRLHSGRKRKLHIRNLFHVSAT